MKGRISRTTYHLEDDEPVFDIYGRNENKEKFHLEVHGTQPYFFTKVYPSNLEGRWEVEQISEEGVTLENEQLYKIVTRRPEDVGKLRNFVPEHFEADVVYRNRIRYDYGWKDWIEFDENKNLYQPDDVVPITGDETFDLRMNILDIETVDDEGFEDPHDAGKKIVSTTFYDNYIDKYCCIVVGKYRKDDHKEIIREHLKETDTDFDINLDKDIKVVPTPDEEGLFYKMNQWLKKTKPDILTGWNYVKYDHKYIKNRAERCGYNLDLSGITPFDMMFGNDRLSEGKTRNKLEIQADRILGVGKLERTKIHEMFEDDRPKLVAYNILDVILPKRIDEVKDIMSFHDKLSNLCGIDMDNTRYTSSMADAYIFHRLQGIARLPSKEHVKGDVSKEKVKGGHVGSAEVALLNHVAVVDFKSEYPMCIVTFNMSPETYVDNPKPNEEYYTTPNGNYYKKEPEGLVPKILNELLKERDDIKERMKEEKRNNNTERYEALNETQRALKIFMNSFFGLMSSKKGTFRLANKNIGEDITAFAREHIEYTRKVLNKLGYESIYADTDSQFIQLTGDSYEERMEEVENICDRLNESYHDFVSQYNAEEFSLKIEPDKIYEKWYQTGAKKRYAGLLEWKDVDMREKNFGDRLEVKGYEIRRSDQAKISIESQKETLREILTSDISVTSTRAAMSKTAMSLSDLRKHFKKVYDKADKGEIDEKIGRESVITKPPSEYGNDPAHLKAWRWANDNGYSLGIEDPFLTFYSKDGKRIGIPLNYHIPGDIDIDYELMLDKYVEKKIKPFLEPLVNGNFSMRSFLDGIKQTNLAEL